MIVDGKIYTSIAGKKIADVSRSPHNDNIIIIKCLKFWHNDTPIYETYKYSINKRTVNYNYATYSARIFDSKIISEVLYTVKEFLR